LISLASIKKRSGQELIIPGKKHRKKIAQAKIQKKKKKVKEQLAAVEPKEADVNKEAVEEPKEKIVMGPPLPPGYRYPIPNAKDFSQNYYFDITKNSEKLHTIRVELEETLGHYADWLAIPTQKIRNANRFRRGRPIHLGQKIKLPMNEEQAVDFNLKRVQYHMATQEDFYSNYKIDGTEEYTVRRGDTWSGIGRKHDVPLWLLRQYQTSKNLNLSVGDKLTIPEVEELAVATN
jgi:LysM repeat protein